MPFLAKEDILIDPANHSLILPKENTIPPAPASQFPSLPDTIALEDDNTISDNDFSLSIPEGYVYVGNTLMEMTDCRLTITDLVELNEVIQSKFDDSFCDNISIVEVIISNSNIVNHWIAI